MKYDGINYYNFNVLGRWFPSDYGKDMEKRIDEVDGYHCKQRLFCMDCFEYQQGKCKGLRKWGRCKYRQEAMRVAALILDIDGRR